MPDIATRRKFPHYVLKTQIILSHKRSCVHNLSRASKESKVWSTNRRRLLQLTNSHNNNCVRKMAPNWFSGFLLIQPAIIINLLNKVLHIIPPFNRPTNLHWFEYKKENKPVRTSFTFRVFTALLVGLVWFETLLKVLTYGDGTNVVSSKLLKVKSIKTIKNQKN